MSQIKHGAILSYINLGIYVLTGLLYTPWMIRCIGQADYGLYTLAMSIISLLAFDFGLGQATSKFICEYLAEGRQDKADNLISIIDKLYIGIDFVIIFIFCGIYFFLPDIYQGLSSQEMSSFKILYIIAVSYCVLSFPFIPQNGILTGYEKFIALKGCEIFNRVFVVVTMAICLIYGYGLYALVIVNSIGGILTIGIKQYLIRKDTPLKINLRFWEKSEFKRILKFIIWVTLIALSQRMIFNIAPSILGVFSNSTEIAILGVAIVLEAYSFLFASAVGGLFLPKVSRMVHENSIESVLELMIKVGRIQVLICGLILIWFIFLGKNFVNLWVGPNYNLVYPVTLLFIIPNFIHLPQEIAMTYIVASNKVKQQAYIYLITGVVNLLLAFPLAKFMGVLGIGIAIFLSFILRSVLLNIFFYNTLKLNILKFFKDSFANQLFFLLIGATIFFIISLIPFYNWLWFVIKNILGVTAYAIIFYRIGANSYEKSLVKSIIRFKIN